MLTLILMITKEEVCPIELLIGVLMEIVAFMALVFFSPMGLLSTGTLLLIALTVLLDKTE